METRIAKNIRAYRKQRGLTREQLAEVLGYKMKDNKLNTTVKRLWEASRSQDYDALPEAEKAVRRYPHSFDVVYAAANL